MQNTLAAIAFGAFIIQGALAQNEDAVRAEHTEPTFCVAMYAPSTCTGVYGGEHYQSRGTNTCVAIQSMVKTINNAYLWFIEVRAEDIQKLICNEKTPSDSNAERNLEPRPENISERLGEWNEASESNINMRLDR